MTNKNPANTVRSRAEAAWPTLIGFAKETLGVGNFVEAEEAALRALEEAEKLDLNDRRLGITLEVLADVYYSTQRYASGIPVMVRLLEMYRRCLGREHIDTATIVGNLAILYHACGRLLEAEDYYEEALEIKTAALGKDHPDVQTIQAQHSKMLHDLVGNVGKKKPHVPKSTDLKKSGQYERVTLPSERLTLD